MLVMEFILYNEVSLFGFAYNRKHDFVYISFVLRKTLPLKLKAKRIFTRSQP